MDQEKKPSEPVRLEVEVLIDAIEAKEDQIPEAVPNEVAKPGEADVSRSADGS